MNISTEPYNSANYWEKKKKILLGKGKKLKLPQIQVKETHFLIINRQPKDYADFEWLDKHILDLFYS